MKQSSANLFDVGFVPGCKQVLGVITNYVVHILGLNMPKLKHRQV